MRKSNFLRILSIIGILINFVLFAGEEACSPSNAKFNKADTDFEKITDALLSGDLWRNPAEKQKFFNCVRAEQDFVTNILRETPLKLKLNYRMNLGPNQFGTLMPGNTRNLRVFPIEVELEPGEYVFWLYYSTGEVYARAIPYYSSEAVQIVSGNNRPYVGSWNFSKGNDGQIPRIYDSFILRVNSNYKNGKKVKKAVFRVMLSFGLFPTSSDIEIAISNKPEVINLLKSNPYEDAAYTSTGRSFRH